jgi:hypothetical protein
MSRHPPSNIRVSVHFSKSTVFAGEDVECTITFKNTAREPGSERSPSRSPVGLHPPDRQRRITPIQTNTRPSISRNSSFGPNIPAHLKRGHRPTHSLGAPPRLSNGPLPETQLGDDEAKHGRKLSIISMGTDTAAGGGEQGRMGHEQAWKSARGHGRSSSLQTVPRRGKASPFIGTYTKIIVKSSLTNLQVPYPDNLVRNLRREPACYHLL